MKRDPDVRCDTCGRFIRDGDQCYVADENDQPFLTDSGEMVIECPACDRKRITPATIGED